MRKAAITSAIFFIAALTQSTPIFAQNTVQNSTPAASSSPTAELTASGNTEAKRELARKVIEAQQGEELERLFRQLAQSAVGPAVEPWAQRLQAMPKARQDAADKRLGEEVDKFANAIQAVLRSRAAQATNEALVPAYIERFSEGELQQLLVFFTSPVIKKYQENAQQLGSVLVRRLVELTRDEVERLAREFDVSAARALGVSAPAPQRPASGQR